MTEHPLTDEVIGKTFNFSGEYTSRWYDEEDMRAAADWQYEQVFQAWEQCLESDTDIQVIRRFDQKLKAMRPTATQAVLKE